MRTLASTLTTAQKAASHKPHPKVEVYDKIAGIARHTWTRFYTGSEEDYFHACCMPADGSLIRLRVTSAAGALYRQRVTSPASGSTYSSWTNWSKDAYAVAVCASGVNVWAFCIDVSDGHLYRSDSTNSGASFGAWTDMGDVSGDNTFRLAACAKSTTEAIVLYADGADISRRRLASGTWEAAAAWSLSMSSITGIAVHYEGDWNVVVTGTEATTLKPIVNTCLLGDDFSEDADTWTSLEELTVAENGSNLAFKFPTLDMPDVFRTFFVEDYDGSEAYSRPYWSHGLVTANFVSNLWREPVPFNLSSDYGLAMCYKSPNVWLTRPDGVWQATLAADSVEITNDVLRIENETGETTGRITIVLRNDDGRYANIGVADDTYEVIKLGAEINFSPGYHTTSGSSPEHSTGLAHWITGWDYTSSGGHAEFILYGIDGWGLLQRWKARRQFKWAAEDKNIFQLLSFILARAGLELATISSTSAITDHKPAFTISTGESGKTAVLRLLARVEDVLFFRGEYGYLKDPRAGPTQSGTFYPDAHIESTSVDGRCSHSVSGGDTWATFQGGAGTDFTDQSSILPTGFRTHATEAGKWRNMYRPILLLDISDIPSGSTILTTIFSPHGTSSFNDDSLSPTINVYLSAPASNTALEAGDFNSLGTSAYCDTAIAYANWSTTGYNDFTFNADPGIVAVQAALDGDGILKLGLREVVYDVADSEPGTVNLDKRTELNSFSADRGIGYAPKAVITYTVPVASFDYAYHMPGSETNHRITEGLYGERIKYANRAQVFGDEPTAIFTEDFDWTELNLVYDILAQNIDINLDSVARCHTRGDAIKADATLQSLTGYIVVPLNCGQEMYDYIEITDSRADLSAEKKRVLGLKHVYNPAKGRYDMTVYFRGAGGGGGIYRSRFEEHEEEL